MAEDNLPRRVIGKWSDNAAANSRSASVGRFGTEQSRERRYSNMRKNFSAIAGCSSALV